MSLLITSSQVAKILRAAILSRGVFYKFTITSFPPFFTVSTGMSAAGVTRRDEPIAIQRSAFLPL